jgi:TATA-box binding protein (TBP) (component of TFIID and TFIIIB)
MEPFRDPLLNNTENVLPECHNLALVIWYDVWNRQNSSTRLDLRDFPNHFAHVKNGRNFAAAIVKYEEPRATLLVFARGICVCVGTHSFEQARLVAQIHKTLMMDIRDPVSGGLKYEIRDMQMALTNRVATCSLGYCLDLEAIEQDYRSQVDYVPENFPGLSFRLTSHHARVCLVADTGNVIVIGSRDMASAIKAFHEISGILPRYRDETVPTNNKMKHVHRLVKRYNDVYFDSHG